MRHARQPALDELADLIAEVRCFPQLTERRRGVFYRGSRAFLHFHEDPAGLFADVKTPEDWDRWPVNSAAERAALVRSVAERLG